MSANPGVPQLHQSADPVGQMFGLVRFADEFIHRAWFTEADPRTGAVSFPIFQTSTFAQHALGETPGEACPPRHNPPRPARRSTVLARRPSSTGSVPRA